MWIFFKFISGIYLKNFFIIFFGLLGFYCGIDLLLNFKNLPSSANLDLLYVLFLAFSAINYILPISLVFALVLSLVNLIRNNELVSFYALGISRNLVILFPFCWALLFCLAYVGLNFTPFAYANDYQNSILRSGSLLLPSNEVFLKFDNNFIYIQNTNDKSLSNVKIFTLKNGSLSSFVKADEARLDGSVWSLKDANKTSINEALVLGKEALSKQSLSEIQNINGFNPKTIENIVSKNDVSILDALQSIELFKAQNINITDLKIALYKLIFTPFFAPFLMLIMYYFFPVISRFFSLAFVSFSALISTFLLWGTLFLATRLAQNGVINAELGIILPVIILAFFASFLFYKHA